MGDDLANGWGRTLCFSRSRRGHSSCTSGGTYSNFERLIATSSASDYKLTKVVACGSDANLWALAEATHFETSRIMVGSGCYVAGDCGPLQNLSTSYFDVVLNATEILPPTEDMSLSTRMKTVALPYFIPCKDFKGDRLLAYENDCLRALHIRCLQGRLKGEPFKVLLLELILAGTGGTLSDRVLEALGDLAKVHQFSILVDEIMTGGRTSATSVLLTQSKPAKFRAAVSHVTLGKFPGLGLILRNRNLFKPVVEGSGDMPRGVTTVLECQDAMDSFQTVSESLKNIPARRQAVLDKLKLKERDCWGEGLLIFINKRRADSIGAIKNRVLPLIEKAPIQSVPFHACKTLQPHLSCKRLVKGVRHYLTFAGSSSDKADLELCLLLADEGILESLEPSRAQIKMLLQEHIDNKSFTELELVDAVSRAEREGLLARAVKGKKRRRVMVINVEQCRFPAEWNHV